MVKRVNHNRHIRTWKKSGKEKPYGWHIHHLDGNSDNNELDNLVCVSPEMHYLIHKALFERYGKQQDLAAMGYLWRKDFGTPPSPPWNKGKKTGQTPWNKGIPMTQEVKDKVSKAKKGQIPPNKHKGKKCVDLDTGKEYGSKMFMADSLGLSRCSKEFKRRCTE